MSGSSSSTRRPASGRSSSHQSGYQRADLGTRSTQSGVSLLVLAADSGHPITLPLLDEVQRHVPRLHEIRRARGRLGLVPGDGRGGRRHVLWPNAKRRCAPMTYQHPVPPPARPARPKGATLSHRNILNNAYFTGARAALHRERPRLRAGALLPLLRHGARQLSLHRSWRVHRRAGRILRSPRRPGDGLQAERCTSFTACRRCSSPSGEADFDQYQLSQPAHGHHGRRAVPGRTHESWCSRKCT